MWGEKDKKDLCNKNAENRSKRLWQSTTGSISAPNHHIRLGLSVDDPTGIIKTFHTLHYNEERGWKSDAARIAYEAMTQMRQEHPFILEDENSMTDLDIMESILGRQPCYRKGWSRKLPYRLQVSNTSNTGGSELDIENILSRIEEFMRSSQSQGDNNTAQSPQPVSRDLNILDQRLSRLEDLLSQHQPQAESNLQEDSITRVEEILSQLAAEKHPTQTDFEDVVGKMIRVEDTVANKMTRVEEVVATFAERYLASSTAHHATRSTFRRQDFEQ